MRRRPIHRSLALGPREQEARVTRPPMRTRRHQFPGLSSTDPCSRPRSSHLGSRHPEAIGRRGPTSTTPHSSYACVLIIWAFRSDSGLESCSRESGRISRRICNYAPPSAQRQVNLHLRLHKSVQLRPWLRCRSSPTPLYGPLCRLPSITISLTLFVCSYVRLSLSLCFVHLFLRSPLLRIIVPLVQHSSARQLVLRLQRPSTRRHRRSVSVVTSAKPKITTRHLDNYRSYSHASPHHTTPHHITSHHNSRPTPPHSPCTLISHVANPQTRRS